jgi:hypothetical protein
MSPVLLLFALGCSQGSGTASIENGEYAPWEFSSAKSVLWTTEPGTNGRSGEALLLLTTADTDCDGLTETFGEDSFQVLGDATGLAFALMYWRDTGRLTEPDWTGLYMGMNYDLGSGGDDEQGMGVLAFHAGNAYVLSYYGSGAWLRIDRADQDAVEGEFFATHWWGSFAAEPCGPWDEPHWDTGWDSR